MRYLVKTLELRETIEEEHHESNEEEHHETKEFMYTSPPVSTTYKRPKFSLQVNLIMQILKLF